MPSPSSRQRVLVILTIEALRPNVTDVRFGFGSGGIERTRTLNLISPERETEPGFGSGSEPEPQMSGAAPDRAPGHARAFSSVTSPPNHLRHSVIAVLSVSKLRNVQLLYYYPLERVHLPL